MATKKTTPSKSMSGGSSKLIDQHKKMAMGEKVTGQTLKGGGSVKHRSSGGRSC